MTPEFDAEYLRLTLVAFKGRATEEEMVRLEEMRAQVTRPYVPADPEFDHLFPDEGETN